MLPWRTVSADSLSDASAVSADALATSSPLSLTVSEVSPDPLATSSSETLVVSEVSAEPLVEASAEIAASTDDLSATTDQSALRAPSAFVSIPPVPVPDLASTKS